MFSSSSLRVFISCFIFLPDLSSFSLLYLKMPKSEFEIGRYGGKWIFGLSLFCASILTMFTPLAASWGVGWLIALRILEGLFEVIIKKKSCHYSQPIIMILFVVNTNDENIFIISSSKRRLLVYVSKTDS